MQWIKKKCRRHSFAGAAKEKKRVEIEGTSCSTSASSSSSTLSISNIPTDDAGVGVASHDVHTIPAPPKDSNETVLYSPRLRRASIAAVVSCTAEVRTPRIGKGRKPVEEEEMRLQQCVQQEILEAELELAIIERYHYYRTHLGMSTKWLAAMVSRMMQRKHSIMDECTTSGDDLSKVASTMWQKEAGSSMMSRSRESTFSNSSKPSSFSIRFNKWMSQSNVSVSDKYRALWTAILGK
mmetsp:Transcript_36051/g.58256  ORF Transcript_36051/g.58256 Transcript_36051/m.58256 type:complete len:238 (+) Transcript_36051:59-772(+)